MNTLRLGTRRRLNLALQGGGAHGAFTWGVLDALLEDGSIEFGWVSATSAGAVNAAALACGLASGGGADARDRLRQVWQAVEAARLPDFLRLNPFLAGFSRSSAVGGMVGLLSPYDFNPLGFDPLRKLLTDHVDFAKIRASSPIELLIAATDVATGRARLFRRPEMTVEAILASACLPTLHHAVVIDGRAYWDGGFSANPELITLATESPVEDTLIVQLNPLHHADVPRSARDITDRVNAITFNQPLLRDVESIVAAQDARIGWFAGRRERTAMLKRHRFHMIEAGRYTVGLDADSKLKPDKGLLAYLHGAGHNEGRKWLERHRISIGRSATVDLKARFFAASAPQPEPYEAREAAPDKTARQSVNL